jgi:predicted Zn-dependent protease with MMP-like domain
MEMLIEEFEKLVREAVEGLPENIKNAMKNIAVVIEEKPIRNNLLGLYQGIPENQWGKNEAIRLPDKITIFKVAIEGEAQSPEDVKELVKIVVWHEIAHHFGFDESGARQLENKWRAGMNKSSRY